MLINRQGKLYKCEASSFFVLNSFEMFLCFVIRVILLLREIPNNTELKRVVLEPKNL